MGFLGHIGSGIGLCVRIAGLDRSVSANFCWALYVGKPEIFPFMQGLLDFPLSSVGFGELI